MAAKLLRNSKDFDPEHYQPHKNHYKNQPLCLVTPEFKIVAKKADGCLFLRFRRCAFLELIKLFDNLFIQDYAQRNKVDLFEIVQRFQSTLLMNTVNSEQQIISLQLERVGNLDVTKCYDELGERLPHNVIDQGFKGVAIIRPIGLKDIGGVFKLKWSLEQLKVIIPDVYFSQCLLPDQDEESVAIPL